ELIASGRHSWSRTLTGSRGARSWVRGHDRSDRIRSCPCLPACLPVPRHQPSRPCMLSLLLTCVTCVAAANGVPARQSVPPLKTIRVASGLSGPVYVAAPPGDLQRLFIVEFNTGRIRILKSGALLATPFLDIG